jgi:hypothetical protein
MIGVPGGFAVSEISLEGVGFIDEAAWPARLPGTPARLSSPTTALAWSGVEGISVVEEPAEAIASSVASEVDRPGVEGVLELASLLAEVVTTSDGPRTIRTLDPLLEGATDGCGEGALAIESTDRPADPVEFAAAGSFEVGAGLGLSFPGLETLSVDSTGFAGVCGAVIDSTCWPLVDPPATVDDEHPAAEELVGSLEESRGPIEVTSNRSA